MVKLTGMSREECAGSTTLALKLGGSPAPSSGPFRLARVSSARDVLISIQEREYTMDLIVLPGLAIDVILGMKWMSDHGVLIDTSTRTIMLREPKGGNAFLVPLP